MSTDIIKTEADQSAPNNEELQVFYYVGSTITLAASLFVIFSYVKFKACRQHPSSLIFWRSVSDVIFALQFIILFGTENPSDRHCNIFSFLFQFSVLSSQSWYFMNAVDLMRSMRNPFTDPAANIPVYHCFVWGMSFITSIAITASSYTDYRQDMQLCWTRNSSTTFNYVNWLTFFIPTLTYYIFSIGTVVYAALRLKRGLEETFRTRQIVLLNGIRYVAGFCAYWTFAGIIYGIIILRSKSSNDPTVAQGPHENLPLYATFAVTIAFRGVVDVAIWIYNQRVHVLYRKWYRGEPHEDAKDIGMDAADINRALRREVLIFSTTGIALAIDRSHAVPFSDMLPTLEQYPASLDPAEPRNMHSVVRIPVLREDYTAKFGGGLLPGFSTLNLGSMGGTEAFDRHRSVSVNASDAESVPFLDYSPQVFRYLRFQFGIDESKYKASIQGKTEAMIEKFTEGGRSGSFFYFSEDGSYIVKTLTTTEGKFLVKWLPRYVDYVSRNRNSLVTRFCGFHAITLYNLTIHFIVMQSVFMTNRKIHERYDLKGSYIDRHAGSGAEKKNHRSPFNDGQRRGGFKNIVYKDNDLNRTVRISEKDRLLFLHQIRKDAYFLRDSNIMDYSLLLGVHHTSHVVPVMSPPSKQGSMSGETAPLIPNSPSSASLVTAAAGANSPRGSSSQSHVGLFQKDDGGVQASIIEGPGIYFFGLIDVLQEWNTSKQLERFAKIYLRCKDGKGISSCHPAFYAERFIRFMSNMTREDDENILPVMAAYTVQQQQQQANQQAGASSSSSADERKEITAGSLPSRTGMKAPLFAGNTSSDDTSIDVQVSSDAASSASIHAGVAPVSASINGVGVDQHPHPSFLNPSSLSSTQFAVHPSSDPTSSTLSAGHESRGPALAPMGITDSAHGTRSALASTSGLGWSSI